MPKLEDARALDQLGLNVLPAKFKGKRPIVSWQQFQDKRTTPQLSAWFSGGREYNLWVATGSISGCVVLDCDNQQAQDHWREKLGDLLEGTTCVKTAKGYHWWFKLADGDNCASWSIHEGGLDFDVRGDGTGVIVPPSIHESGVAYSWVRGPEHMLPLPNALRGLTAGAEDSPGFDQRKGRGRKAPRHMLAKLLRDGTDVGGRNDWLTRVCGHMAKMVPYEDAYLELVRLANESLSEPLDGAELKKTMESVWRTEQKRDRGQEPAESNGYLTSDGRVLYTMCKLGEDMMLQPWSDFDIQVLGVIEGDDERSYSVEIVRGEERRRDLLEPNVLGRTAELQVWLARHGATILPPNTDMHKGNNAARLQRYLEAQEAPQSHAVTHLGWHDAVDGYVTHEGVIKPDGLHPHEGIQPHPRLANWADYRYGFTEVDTAKQVLAEILTFHDETVTAVFGAWWAACFLKAQIMAEASLFPFMALEAPSESGKTTGFFSLMVQLNGNREGHSEFTIPVLRDRASAHRNGVVWVDDMSQPEAVLDLLRQATSEGSRAKKGADRHRQETVRLVAPIVISGEGLGALSLEKALLDRAVRLEVGSPKGRMSQHDPSRPQWDDIVDMLKQWDNDLTQLAGTMVQMALGQARRVKDLRSLRPGSGRHADKIAIVRLGARVLAEMAEQPGLVERVDEWVDAYEDTGDENVLTRQMLPQILRSYGLIPRNPMGHVPIFLDEEGVLWYSEEGVADIWRTTAHGSREAQLGSLDSIRSQRKVLGISRHKRWSIRGGRKRGEVDQLRTYWALSTELTGRVLSRTGSTVAAPQHHGKLELAD